MPFDERPGTTFSALRWAVACALGAGATAAPLTALSAGFAILEQSVKGLGAATAGVGANATDASDIWFNPATMSALDEQVYLGAHLIFPSFEYTPRSTAADIPASGPLFASSDLTSDGGDEAFVPNFTYTRPLSDNWHGSISINAPYGLATHYDNDWIGRYRTIESEITTISLNPSLAYSISDELSLGFGVSLNYIDVTLSNAIDFAGLCAQVTGALCPNGALPSSGVFDGKGEVSGDDLSWGFNMGVFWKPREDLNLGFAYRSEIEHDLEGEVDFDHPSALGGFPALGPLLGAGLAATFADGDANAEITLPDTATLSARLAMTEATSLMATAAWTGWSDVQEIRIEFENALTPTTVEELRWENTWRYAVGVEHRFDEKLTLRAGYAYDEAPVPNARYRTPRLPDNDRQWLAIGLSTQLTQNLSLDAGYAHIFIDDTDIEWVRDNGDLLVGEYESAANNFSLALNLTF